MKPFRSALIEFYPEVKRLDGRHKWIEKFVTGNRSVEHHCYECSKCGKVARLVQLTMYGIGQITRRAFIPALRKQIYERTPLLTLLMKTKRKKFPAVFSKRHQEV